MAGRLPVVVHSTTDAIGRLWAQAWRSVWAARLQYAQSETTATDLATSYQRPHRTAAWALGEVEFVRLPQYVHATGLGHRPGSNQSPPSCVGPGSAWSANGAAASHAAAAIAAAAIAAAAVAPATHSATAIAPAAIASAATTAAALAAAALAAAAVRRVGRAAGRGGCPACAATTRPHERRRPGCQRLGHRHRHHAHPELCAPLHPLPGDYRRALRRDAGVPVRFCAVFAPAAARGVHPPGAVHYGRLRGPLDGPSACAAALRRRQRPGGQIRHGPGAGRDGGCDGQRLVPVERSEYRQQALPRVLRAHEATRRLVHGLLARHGHLDPELRRSGRHSRRGHIHHSGAAGLVRRHAAGEG